MRARRVLALEVVSTVCAFVVLEGTERLVEWGSRGVTDDVSRFLPKLDREVMRYRPDVLVVEDAGHSKKGERVRTHLAWVEQWADDHELLWSAIARTDLKTWSEHLGPTKEARAGALATLFPELKPLVPPPRKVWEAEAKRLSVFVALQRALCYYERSGRA